MDITQLQIGEIRLGEYLVQIARPTASGWVAGIPPITATITNRRLILVPQTRKPYPPASIPSDHITQAVEMLLGQRRAVQIRLTIDYNLHLFIGWGQGEEFMARLQKMLTPPDQHAYKPVLLPHDLKRLIEEISNL
ncbi:MAG: hypothetical protein K8J31_22410 [Anaerolineae bacterium]|nr:hypothetical protein [Anaerolineae bacterium]